MAMRIARQRQNLNLPLLNLDFFGCCSLTPFSNSHYLFLRPALKSNCLASIMRWSDPSQMASGNGTNFQWVLDYRSPQLSSPSNLLHTFRGRSFHHCSSSLFFSKKVAKILSIIRHMKFHAYNIALDEMKHQPNFTPSYSDFVEHWQSLDLHLLSPPTSTSAPLSILPYSTFDNKIFWSQSFSPLESKRPWIDSFNAKIPNRTHLLAGDDSSSIGVTTQNLHVISNINSYKL